MIRHEFGQSSSQFFWKKPREALAWALFFLFVLRAPSLGGCHPTSSNDGAELRDGEVHCGSDEDESLHDMMCGRGYMIEMYDRMKLMDQAATSNGTEDHDDGWQRIICFNEIETRFLDRFTFNISMLSTSDNLTMAKIAIATRRGQDNSCEAIVKGSRSDSEALPCENKPFRINNLASIDVTSLLAARLGRHHFYVHVQHLRSVVGVSLIVFNGIDTDALLFNQTPARCKMPASRNRREARAPFFPPKGRNNRRLDRNSSSPGLNVNDDNAEVQQSLKVQDVRKRSYVVRSMRRSASIQRLKAWRDQSERTTSHNPAIKKLHSHREDVKRNKEYGEPQSSGEIFEPLASNNSTTGSRTRLGQSGGGRRVLREKRALQAGHDFHTASQGHSAMQTPSKLKQYLHQRRRRSVELSSQESFDVHASPQHSCRVEPLRLTPFDDLNLGDFIAPEILNIGQCGGTCPPILFPNERVTHNSYIMSVLHSRSVGNSPYPAPSCRPRKYQSFPVYRFLDTYDDVTVLERWRDARVIECGCV
ncbi:hypothetical protein V1264_023118 [Littorina saxatilis]|uniref:TGF-beta family profile domain-containing protein n=1 Tax=Littorina saxatilis TaxID=31220 RepID=A0AAN9B7G1_9CAEN